MDAPLHSRGLDAVLLPPARPPPRLKAVRELAIAITPSVHRLVADSRHRSAIGLGYLCMARWPSS